MAEVAEAPPQHEEQPAGTEPAQETKPAQDPELEKAKEAVSEYKNEAVGTDHDDQEEAPAAAGDGSYRMTGKCKWFNNSRGYGFIEGEDGQDYFVHQTSIHAPGYKSLAENEELEFELHMEDGRMKAVKVTGPAGRYVQGNNDRQGGGGFGGGGGYGGGRSNVCFAWQKGQCDRGDACKFSHSNEYGDSPFGGGGGGGGGGGFRGGGGGGYRGGGGGGGYNSYGGGGGGYGGGYGMGGGGGGGSGGARRGVCFAWQKGECRRGDSCRFSHPPEEEGVQSRPGGQRHKGGNPGICYAWQAGECYRGDTCKFLHHETE